MDRDERSEDDAAGHPDAAPDPDDVAYRAEGRPPEERSSDNPKAQAEAILRDSEDRISEGSGKSEHRPPTGTGGLVGTSEPTSGPA
jgi:hypothetical protein